MPLITCSLCGAYVLEDEAGVVSWRNQFRALYRPAAEYSVTPDALITGVGLYKGLEWSRLAAPRWSEGRWDDGHSDEDSDDEDSMKLFPEPPPGYNEGVFFLHDVCWRLLVESSPEGHIYDSDLDGLFRTFGSFLSTWDRNIWETSEDDAQTNQNSQHPHSFPWEPRSICHDPKTQIDPYNVPDLCDIINAPPQSPPEGHVTSPGRIPTCRFGKLSEEIRTLIATHLTTSDFLNVRLATRAFWPVFHHQQFWLNQCRSERAWLFETLRDGTSHDWRSIYRLTRQDRLPDGTANRRRVWNLASRIWDILDLTYYDPSWEGPYIPRGYATNCSTYDVAFGLAFSEEQIRKYRSGESRGDGSLIPLIRMADLAIPKCRSRLSIALKEGYVTGIEFEHGDGQTSRAGCWGPTSAVQSCTLSSPLRGLNIAMKENGISALQCITETDGTSNPWIGYPASEASQTRILGTHNPSIRKSSADALQATTWATSAVGDRVNNPLRTLEIYNDAFKIIALGATGDCTPLGQHHGEDGVALEQNYEYRIRRSDLWFPALPPPDVHLNETSFMPSEQDSRFRGMISSPFLWIRFGGEGKPGGDLARLVKITAHYSGGDVKFMEFGYENDRRDGESNAEGVEAEAEAEVRFLGRHKPQPSRRRGCRRGGFVLAGPTEFAIDGPGGERIEKVGVHQKAFQFGTALQSVGGTAMTGFTITTNRGRSCFFGDALMNYKGTTVRTVETAPGTTITGFYVTHGWEDNTEWYQGTGFQSLGVMSEKLDC